MATPKIAVKDKGWWHDIREHRYAVLVWVVLHVLDFGLTEAAANYGINISSGYFAYSYELNWFLRDLSTPVFALQKFCLTAAAVMWLAIWRWLWFLKWLNLAFLVFACWNIYDFVKLL